MILNKTNYPCLYDDGSVEYDSKPWAHRFKPMNDFNYWYIEVLYTWRSGNDTTKNFEDFIPPDILEKIKHDNSTKLLLYTVEPVNVIVENIYQFISKFDIPVNKILLMCELVDINDEVNRVSSNYGMDPIDTFFASVDETGISIQITLNSEVFNNLDTLEKKKYDKAFINLNRRWRPHRPLFVGLLCCNDLLDKGYVSLSSTSEGSSSWAQTVAQLSSVVDADIRNLFSANYNRLVSLPELNVDTDDLSVNLVRLDDLDNTVDFYKNSYFSVVSETCFFENVGRFLTEKTFKAIAHKHPFLMIGPPNTLDTLRQLKYKTFHPFIDESYDREPDHIKRMKMVVEETKRLSSMSQSELYDWIDNVKPIVEHNFKILSIKPNYLRVNK